MSKPKFADGPYVYEPRGQTIWQGENMRDGYMIADVRGWGYLTSRAPSGPLHSEEEAIAIQNATGELLAAAPDMYAALELLLSAYLGPSMMICRCAVDQAEKALAKARGEEVKE